MILRRKIRIQFSLIVLAILVISLVSIYFSIHFFRKNEFYNQMYNKAKTAAILLMDFEEMDANLLKKFKEYSTSKLPNENIHIYDNHNKLIFHSDSTIWKFSDLLFSEIKKNGQKKFSIAGYDGLGFIYQSKNGNVPVIILASDQDGIFFLSRLRIILLTVFIISTLVIIIAGKIYADKILQPLNDFIKQVNSIGISNLKERLDPGKRTDEISKLARAFNHMLNRLEAAFQSQKLFIANASHELRTPLTVISGQLEVLLLKQRPVSDYETAVKNTHNDIMALIHMANRLLILAHASSDFSEINFTTIRFDDAIWTARQELLKLHSSYNINVKFSDVFTDDAQFKIKGNETLLTSAFSNLMENGCKYSRNHTVDIVLEITGNNVVVKFTDKGIGIKKEELSLLFAPFYRGSNISNIRGKGIGLSIVNKVIALHHGSISVNSEPGKGSEFIVTIPLQQTPSTV